MPSFFFKRSSRLRVGVICAIFMGSSGLGAQTGSQTPTFVPSGAQGTSSGLGNVQLSDVLQQMRGRVWSGETMSRLGLHPSCDYQRYVSMVNNAVNNDPALKSMMQVAKPGGRWGLPSTDILGSVFQFASHYFDQHAFLTRQKSLIESVEQMCQSTVQADQMERQLEIEAASRSGTARTLGSIMSSPSAQLPVVNYDSVAMPVKDSIDKTLTYATRGGVASEAAWRTTDLQLQQQEEAGIALKRRVEEVSDLATQAYASFFVLSDASGRCPNGGTVSTTGTGSLVLGGVSVGICGQGTPEKAAQVQGALDVYEAELQMLLVTAETRRVIAEAANHQVWAYAQERLDYMVLRTGAN